LRKEGKRDGLRVTDSWEQSVIYGIRKEGRVVVSRTRGIEGHAHQKEAGEYGGREQLLEILSAMTFLNAKKRSRCRKRKR